MHRFGANGVLTVGLLAGAILVVLACARVGGLVRPVPMPVIEGFTAGIAVVIALQQVPAALGVDGGQHEHVWAAAAAAVAGFVMAPTWSAVALAVGVAALMLLGPRLLPALPFSLVGVALATLVVAVAGLDVALIERRARGRRALGAEDLQRCGDRRDRAHRAARGLGRRDAAVAGRPRRGRLGAQRQQVALVRPRRRRGGGGGGRLTRDLSSLRLFCCFGAPIPRAIVREARRRLPGLTVIRG